MRKSTARTLIECRRLGYVAEIVERWIAQARQRRDLFGVIDVLALDEHPGCLGIQACWMSDLGKHREKLRESPHVPTWLAHNNRLELWAWRKLRARKKDGKVGKRSIWTVHRESVTTATIGVI